MRRTILWLHGWIGITVGAWLAIVGLTGAILMWKPEAEPAMYSGLTRALPIKLPIQVRLEEMYRTVREAYPDVKVDRIYLPREDYRAVEFRLPSRDASVFVNPYTGQIIGELEEKHDFFHWVDEIHIRMLSGEVGHTLVGIAGFFLATIAVSGARMWWPRRGQWKRAFVPRWKTNWRGRVYELHRVWGACVCVMLLASAVTGISLVWPDATKALLGRAFGMPPKEAKAKGKQGKWLPLDELLAKSETALPGGEFTRINWPKKAGGLLVLRKQMPGELNPAGNSSVSIDPVTGKVASVEDSSKAGAVVRVMNLRYPLHTGLWGGVLTRLVWTLVGLSLPLFYVSGWVMWLGKRRKRVNRGDAKTQRN